MTFRRVVRSAWLALTSCCAILAPAGTPLAAPFLEFVDPNPASGNWFGRSVVALSTGNVVITSPFDDAGGTDAGAVYLFNGSTGALISILRGSAPNNNVGSDGVTALSNGNYVVRSPLWDNGAFTDVGAVSWGNGTTGVSGTVSSINSLIGSTASDQVGSGGVTALSNGHYVVRSPLWNSGAVADAGAASWGNGTIGVAGAVSAGNSLVGSTASDLVGNGGVTALSNGNYVVVSPNWDGGGVANKGAVTWCNGTTGLTGLVADANSLRGSQTNDNLGGGGVVALSNGSYVVLSPNWNILDVGAATWCNGTSAVIGLLSDANSLIGSTATDLVGSGGVTVLTNGNYVVRSPNWDNGAAANAGAASWGDGTIGVIGEVSDANSLVGSTTNDNVGGDGVTALTNGNYVVASGVWNNGAIADAGAATWGNGATGVVGTVSAANSLVGSAANHSVGGLGVTALSNGHYVVRSPGWDNGAVANVGAATWGDGTTGLIGVVSVANSLVGSTAGDQIGSLSIGLTALSNGNYVVTSRNWDNGAITNAGAATWCDGATAVTGAVSAANSLVGSAVSHEVGGGGVTALSNGNYVVRSPGWDNGFAAGAGAATWGSGTTGVTGVVSAANSLVGSAANDDVGGSVTALPNGDYVVVSAFWNHGAVVDAGAATWGDGTTGVSGAVSAGNSLFGAAANAGLQPIAADDVNGTFIAAFIGEVPGRVRVGPLTTDPVIVSAVDIPNDQGGWLRLTFAGTDLDDANALPPLAMYGVWRHVPGTSPAYGRASATLGARPDAATVERLRAAPPPGLDVRQVEGRLYVVVPRTPDAGSAAVFPPGDWELVESVPALQQAQYIVAVPTISNAAPNDFVVSAHTTTPSIWHVSEPVSGQSVDNLAPATPAGLAADYSGGQTNLQWSANSENDLGSYRVYRGASADFTPSVENRIATPITPGHADVGPSGGYYKVSAVDVNGNESLFALIGPEGTTDVGGDGPLVFALEGAWPNPTKGRGLHVTFALPSGAAARLELLDVGGRRVLAREVGSLGAGRHTVDLAEGRRVAPGLYWLRLAQGPNRRTTRVAVSE